MIINSDFPNEYTDPEHKKSDSYGLQYAKAILSAHSIYGGVLYFMEDARYRNLVEFAQGNIDIDSLKRMFGFFRNEDENESLSYLDVSVLNMATNLVNGAVGRLARLDYDLNMTVIDPLAIDLQKQYEASVKTFMELKGFLNTIGVSAKEVFSDLDIEAIPEHPDELMVDLQMNPKLKMAMEAEMTIKLIHKVNAWNQILREFAFNLVVIGFGVIYTYHDKNGMPREKNIRPDMFLHSTPINEAFDELDYGGHIERLSPQQFIREASPYMSQVEIQDVLNHYNTRYAGYRGRENEHYDGLGFVEVLRFQFLTENTEKFTRAPKSKGNRVLKKRRYDFEPEPSELPFYESGDKELIKNTYTAKYGGCHVIGTDYVYGYGLQDDAQTQPNDLVNKKLNYFAYAPNMRDGVIVSPLEQIIEPIQTINMIWTKVKKILAKGWMGGREVDFSSLESVAMGKGGTMWDARKVFKFFQQEGILIKRSKVNQYGQSNGRAVEDFQAGLTLADYFQAMAIAGQQIQKIFGMDEYSAGATPPERMLNGVMQQVAENTENNLSYLSDAVHNVYERVSFSQLCLIQQALRNGKEISGMVPALGRGTSRFFKANKEMSFMAMGLIAERRPSQAEWERMYNLIDRAVEVGHLNGGISTADAVFIYEVDNFKQAMEVLLIRQAKWERKAAQLREEQKNSQIEINQSQAKAQSEGQLAVLEKEKELMGLKSDLEAKNIQLKAGLEKDKDEAIEHIRGKYLLQAQGAIATSRVEAVAQSGRDKMISEAIKTSNIANVEK